MGNFFIWNLDIGREAVSTYLFQIILAANSGNLLIFAMLFCKLEFLFIQSI